MTSKPVANVQWLWPCLALAAALACSTDERDLVYGNRVSSGSTRAMGDGGADSSEGGRGVQPEGGAPDIVGEGGEPASGGMPSQGGLSGTGGSGATPSGGSASAGSGGAGGGTGGTATAGGGSGGSGGSPDGGPCGDLDQNGVQDCDETLAANPRFNANLDGWSAEYGVTQVWKTEDARTATDSGSIGVTFTTSGGSGNWALAASAQCLPAWSLETYELGARAYIPAGQAGGQATLNVAMYGNDNCAGSFLGGKSPAFTAESGSWQVLRATLKMLPGTRSMMVRLAASKQGSQASLQVYFDDVLFRKK